MQSQENVLQDLIPTTDLRIATSVNPVLSSLYLERDGASLALRDFSVLQRV